MAGDEESELARLLRAANAGDEASYARFLKACAGFVRAVARSRAGASGIDPEDIVQETLLAIHLKRHTWRDDEPVRPWIAAIVRYKAVDAFRRRGKRVEIEIGDVADTLAEPVSEQASSREVDRALATLPPGQRQVVTSVSVEGHSIGDTATRLGMNEGAVRVALHRGLTALARRFGRREGET